ncbi:hypothetical protein LCGC14_0858140 [marine sediment metagenome]|uniref:Uncharacterized protein n=1 Tax=marine sediment metagenome TaxID=412755 RepID=A0A0F9SFA1_9ZZZZ
MLPSGRSDAARFSLDIARTGGEQVGAGLGALGAGVSDLSVSLARTERVKQAARDDAAFADAIAAENKLVFDEINKIRSTVYGSTDEINTDRERLGDLISGHRDLRLEGMSTRAGAAFSNSSKKSQVARQAQIENALYRKEIDVGRQSASLTIGQAYEIIFSDATSDAQKRDAFESIETTRGGYAEYFKSGELELLEEGMKISAYINVGKFDKARELAAKTKALGPVERGATLQNIDSAEARARNKAKTTSQFIQNAASDEMIEKLIEDPDFVGQEQFDALPFNEDNQKLWSKVLNDRTVALKSGELDPFLISDSIVNRAISTQLEQDVKNLPASEDIIRLIGKGLTPKEAQEYIETANRRRDKDDVLNVSATKDIFAYYQDLFELKAFANLTEKQIKIRKKGGIPVLTQEQLEDNATDLLEVKRDFTNYLKTNEADIKSGKITAGDIEVKGREIAAGPGGAQEKAVFGFWETFGTLTTFSPLIFLLKKSKAEKEFAEIKQAAVDKLLQVSPRSKNQFFEIVGKLKGLDTNKADEYLQKHRGKFNL